MRMFYWYASKNVVYGVAVYMNVINYGSSAFDTLRTSNTDIFGPVTELQYLSASCVYVTQSWSYLRLSVIYVYSK